MANKFTPGPWKMYRGGKVIEVQSTGTVPIVGWTGFDDSFRALKEHEANARLIAAAPDLLEALNSILDILNGDGVSPAVWDQMKTIAREALAKATE